eukprot:TRINITY_DN776114_c0_g1_i1.p1 TRINITY_DN776114_c0_g1~~TRINITY_DN776114_c0_g1_i1.p1  ORF type:complete len:227 (-),score=39.71 TRINITY_DN776114_c0_g1_i1:247-891(-)
MDVQEDLVNSLLKFGKKKKGKKGKILRKKKDKVEKEIAEVTLVKAVEAPSLAETTTYDYDFLLDRMYEKLERPDAGSSRKALPKLEVFRSGSTKTCWGNFSAVCDILRRKPEHVMSYFLAELQTEGSVDGSQRLIVKGRFYPPKIESLLRKYIVEFVQCGICRKGDTDLVKDQSTRLTIKKCNICGASQSVSMIKGGFRAVKRGERRKARMAAK